MRSRVGQGVRDMNRAVAVRVAAVVSLGLGLGCGPGEADLLYMATGEDEFILWADPMSGLTWQDPPYSGRKNSKDAKSYCASLSLAGGGWRLPTISELRSLIRGCAATQVGGSCGVTDSCLSWDDCRDSSCRGCSSWSGPADGCHWPGELSGTCSWYWSSSPYRYFADGLLIDFSDGELSYATSARNHVRCVR